LKRKWAIVVVAVAVLSVGLAVFLKYRSGGQPNNGNPLGLAPLSVRLTWLHQAQFAGFYLASDQGFYKALGLSVDLKPGGIEYPSIKMVSAGSDEIGVAGADQVVLARSKGVPVVALAAMYQKSPVVLFSLKQSGITSPKDLIGKRVGIKYGDTTELTVRALLRKEGISDRDIKEVSVSYDPSPLIQGRVDVLSGFAINEPISLNEKGYDINQILVADYGVHLYADVIFTTEEVLAKKRGTITKFLAATIKGYQYAIDHPDEAASATVKRNTNAKPDHERRMVEASTPLWKPTGKKLGEMQESEWVQIVSMLTSHGLLKEALNPSQFVNYDLLMEAYRNNQ
jgi:NitT/TauT family transport system substrate-binding protein